MSPVYHLKLDKKVTRGAMFAFLPGDPDRVLKIAQAFDPDSREIARNREFRTLLGDLKGEPVLVTSTGIGGPSTAIAAEELARLGVRVFLRVGTSGAIQKDVRAGETVITAAAVRLDGASMDYAPIEYPAVADYEILNSLVASARELKIPFHVGITASTDTFYAGQDRQFSRYMIQRLHGSMEAWQKLGVLNYEMEASTLLTFCCAHGLKGGCITGVAVNRVEEHMVREELLDLAEERAIWIATKSMEKLVVSFKDL